MSRHLPRGGRVIGALLVAALLGLPGSGEPLQRGAPRKDARRSAVGSAAGSLRILADRAQVSAVGRTGARTPGVVLPAQTAALGTYEYSPIVVGPLAGQARSRAYGIDNAGQVTGRSFNFDDVNQIAVDRTAFVWDALGGPRPLPTLSGESGAWGLNNSGQASGFAYTAAGLQRAVRWNTASSPPTITDLGTLINPATLQPGPTSTAYDLNDQGDVTGYSDIPNDSSIYPAFTPFHGILATDAGLRDLGTFDTANPAYQYGYSISYSANAGGKAVGLAHNSSWLFRPFIYDKNDPLAGLRELPTDTAYPTNEWYAVAINDSGMIGGHVIAAVNQSLPYYWTDETAAPVALSMPASFPYGEIYGVNAQGVMVGVMWNDAQEEHAFVFDTLGGVRDLNTLIDPGLGWTLQFARDINDTGQITGSGTVNGLARGFLLTPSALMGAVEGTVRNSETGQPLAGVPVRVFNAAGTQVAEASTDAQGLYTTLPLLPGTYFAIAINTLGGTDQLYAGRPCSGCDPTSGSPIAVVAGGPTLGIDFSIAPPPTLSINDVTVFEGNSGTSIAQFSVTLSATSISAVTVTFATADGTATAGSDYASQGGTLSFAAGETSKPISVTVNGDTTVEPNETFLVNLLNPSGATLADAQGQGTITNDDTAPPSGTESVVWTSVVGATASGNSLTKTAPWSWSNAGAVSTQSIASGDGHLEFTAQGPSYELMAGLGNGDTSQSYVDIEYAIYASYGTLRVYESGTSRGSFGTYSAGDRLRVGVENGVVTYRKNDVVFYQSTAPTYPLLVDTSLASPGATVINALITWTPPPSGTELVVWTSAVGAVANGNSLTKTAPWSWSNAGAVSTQSIVSGDGYLEFTAQGPAYELMAGLGNGDTSQSYVDIEYAIYASYGTLRVYESGTSRGSFGTYAAGDRLRVGVENGEVKYRKNDVVFYQSLTAPTYPLLVDTSLGSTGATVINALLIRTPPPSGTELVVWTSAVGAVANGNSLTKTAPWSWSNAGAVSTQSIASGDGYLEFTAPGLSYELMAGLGNGDTSQSYVDIEYAIYASYGTLRVYESGTSRGSFGTYLAGDRLRVGVESGVVTYRKNDVVFYQSTAPTYPLLVDTSLGSTGATVINALVAGALP